MSQRLIRFGLVPLLVTALAVTLVFSVGWMSPVFAGNNEQTVNFNNDSGNSGEHWSFGSNLAGGNIDESGATKISRDVLIHLTEEEKELANQGFLTCSGSAHFGANGSRTVEPRLKIRCYDAEGKELSIGSYDKSTSTYWVAHASYDYSSGTLNIPAGTATVEYYAKVSIGTKGDLELENMSFYIYNSKPENNFDPIAEPADIQLYEDYDSSGTGIGKITTYRDIFKNSSYRLDISDPDALFRATITNNDNLNRWAQLAYQIYKGNSNAYWDWDGGGFDKDFGTGVYTDLVRDLANKIARKGESTATVMESTGLTMARSFDAAIHEMLELQASLRNRNAKTSDFLARHGTVSLGSDEADTKDQTVFFTSVSVNDQYGSTFKYGYNTMGLIFYDFEIVPLVDEKPYYVKDYAALSPDIQHSSASMKNDSQKDTSFSYDIGTTVSTEVSNTIAHASSTSMTQSHGMAISFEEKFQEAGGGEFTAGLSYDYGFSVSNVFETSESDTRTYSDSYSDSVSTGIETPAHTQANIGTTTQKAGFSMGYDCPVGVSYKVAVVSMNGTYYDDNVSILDMTTADYEHNSFITVFGGDKEGENAAKNLRQRYDNRSVAGNEVSNGYTSLHSMDDGDISNELWWDKICSYGKPSRSSDTSGYNPTLYTATEVLELLGNNEPMIVTGAEIESTENVTDVQVEDFEPLFPLENVWVTNIKVQLRENTIEVPVGGEYYLIDITVGGFDKDNVPYYGFQSAWGSWELLDDATGQPLDPSIAEITVSATTGKAKLKVYQDYDEIVLKYKIPENKYKAVGQENYTTNADLKSTAFVDVVVTGGNAVKETYEDVPENAWYSDAVDFMKNQGMMSGTGKGKFEPGSESTRAMVATVLWNMANSPDPKVQSAFEDLKQNWYEKAVHWAAESGVVSGITDTEFSPDQQITREQLIAMLYRYEKEHGDKDFAEDAVVPTPPVEEPEVVPEEDPEETTGEAITVPEEDEPVEEPEEEPEVEQGEEETPVAPEVSTDAAIEETEEPTEEEEPVVEEALVEEQKDLAGSYVDIGPVNDQNLEIRPHDLQFYLDHIDLSQFSDWEEISEYAIEPFKWAIDKGIIAGNGDGTLNPKGTATRAEIAQILAAYL